MEGSVYGRMMTGSGFILTSSCYGGPNEGVQLLITPDGKLQMTGCDPLQVEITRTVPCQLKHLK